MQRIDSSVRTNWSEVGEVPAAVVESGEVIEVTSASFTEGYTAENMHELVVEQAVAPLTAPILVRGARPGQVVRVDILDLRFVRDFGCILLLPGRGAFPDVTDKLVAKAVGIDDAEVRFSDSIRVPTRKMVGKVSVAPAGERIHSSLPGAHGGNMDNRDIGVGSSVYLPVFVDEAHLGIGDAHAVQGDGECGISAVEVEMVSVIRVTLIPDLELDAPVVRGGGNVMTMGAAGTLDLAAAQALAAMKQLLKASNGLSDQDAAMLMSIACDVHVSQLVNPLVGVKARMPERYIPLP